MLHLVQILIVNTDDESSSSEEGDKSDSIVLPKLDEVLSKKLSNLKKLPIHDPRAGAMKNALGQKPSYK